MIRFNFESRQLWISTRSRGWRHELELSPTDHETVVAELSHRPAGQLPAGGLKHIDQKTPTQTEQHQLIAALGDVVRSPRHPWHRELRSYLELQGFSKSNLFPPTRARGVARTDDRLLAAVAVLWQKYGSRAVVADLVSYTRNWVKKQVTLARDRGLLDGSTATDKAYQLVPDVNEAVRVIRGERM